jgi:RNA polymerase sigma factor (sigma-70 family)
LNEDVDQGFEAFFGHHYDAVVRSLTLAFGDRARAEDAAQAAFERALRKWRVVSKMERPATWVYVVALRGERRRLRRNHNDIVGQEPPSPDVAERVAAEEWIRQALESLPLRQRTAVVLRHLAGLSVAETAHVMGCAEGTVKATVHAAFATLRVELDEEVGLDAH